VLSVAIGLAGLVLAIFYWLLRNIRNRLVTPVLESASLFVALANGELDTPIPKPRGIQEIGNLFRAMEAFKASCVARIDLEREREALITQLQASSDTDFLTGLLNRRAFYTYGEPLFAIAQRYRNDLALILMDIDYFKQVNDRHGHQIGDIVLQQVASLCLRMHRKVDLVARYGGEEFLMLLPHTSLEQATAAAEKLRAAIAAHSLTLPSGTTLDIRASFGVAAYRDDATLDTLIWRADQALYSAKDGGRNQVQRAG
jgi:diguanylate cyclase (GGDEF)-like protein